MALSSAAILAEIKKLEKEKEELEDTKPGVNNALGVMDCLVAKYNMAAILAEQSITIGGNPFDNGKTKATATELRNIQTSIEGVIAEIAGKISDLEGQISDLYAQYEAALAFEAEMEKKNSNQNTGVVQQSTV